MKHRIFDRYQRSQQQKPPPSLSSQVQSPTSQGSAETARIYGGSERLPQQQQHQQHHHQLQQRQYLSPSSSQQTRPFTSSSFNSSHPHQSMDPPSVELYRNVAAVQRNVIPPSTAQSYMSQSNHPVHRWGGVETNHSGGSHHRNHRIGGCATTANTGRQMYDSSSRYNSVLDHNGDRPCTTSASISQQSYTNNGRTVGGHPASVVISPNFDDDYDDNMPSSISSRLSYEPWETAVQPPPFIQETDNSGNNYYNNNYPSVPKAITERRYNNTYSNDSQFEYYHYDTEEVIPVTHSSHNLTSHYSTEQRHPSNRYTTTNAKVPPSTTTANTTTVVESEPKMIEITPGCMARLRDAQETVKAIQNDFYVPCTCVYCDITQSSLSNNYVEPIFCIQDAEYFFLSELCLDQSIG